MYVKVTKSAGHAYIQLAESFRDDSGRPRQRVVSTLGRADEMGGQVDAILNALLRAKGRTAEEPQIEFESALSLGHVWALHRLWESLGFGELARIFRQARYTTAVEHAIRVMVFNRLCDPDSKLGVLRWLETVSIPQVDTASLTHQQLLRSMDALMDHHQAVDAVVAQQLRPMVDQDLSVVFYDLTSIRVEGLSELSDDVRHYGMSKEGVIARQWMLGVVQTAEGLPIYHEVFDGHQAEAPTLLPTLTKVLQRFPHIRRLIIVADRGLLSLDNIQALQAIELGGGRALEFILAVPARRYGEFVDILERFQAKVTDHEQETIDETRWQQLHEVKEAHLAKIIKVDLQSDLFTYNIDGQALRQAQLLDGKLLLVTNVTALNPQAIVQRYKSLADIERGFRVLKSEIELAPVYHRLPQRIRAHAMICFMALILYRVMRQRLKIAQSSLSPERALAQLKRIHRHRIKVNDRALHGVSTLTKDQTDLLGALTLQKPTKHEQLSLL
ncbi:MAG: IS1634 family transposase [Betaproteobacteria bacterium]|nr:IS1634 family transposase [Betaproteobacteria bacterium]